MIHLPYIKWYKHMQFSLLFLAIQNTIKYGDGEIE